MKHGKNSIYVIDLVEHTMNDQTIQEITKKYGNVIYQKIRKDTKEEKGNFAIATFSRKDSTEKTITRLNKTNKYIAERYEHETKSKVDPTQQTDQKKKKKEAENSSSKPKSPPL